MPDESMFLSDAASGGRATCQYDASPDAALTAIRTHEGPVLVDFDETLYLRNSTEDFIDCARPGLRGESRQVRLRAGSQRRAHLGRRRGHLPQHVRGIRRLDHVGRIEPVRG